MKLNHRIQVTNRSMEKIDRAINDAKLHVTESERKLIEWNIKHSERLRNLSTLEIIKDENTEEV